MPTKKARKPRAVVWDLDGTLSDDRARAHFVEVEAGRARDWTSYFDAIDQDPPIAASMEVLRALHAAGLRIVFLTGRPEYTREKTERWLEANGLTDYDVLVMRPRGDYRPSGPFKVDEIARLRKTYELVCAFEDRIDVAGDLREAGVPVFLYGAGMEAAAEALEALDATQDELMDEKESREAETERKRGRKRKGGNEEEGGHPARRRRPAAAKSPPGSASAAKSPARPSPRGGTGEKATSAAKDSSPRKTSSIRKKSSPPGDKGRKAPAARKKSGGGREDDR